MAKKKLTLKQQYNVVSYDEWSKIMLSEHDFNDLCKTVLYDKTDRNKLIYRACVDWPFNVYYQELMRKYPNAKIILTVRDSADKWYESMMATTALQMEEEDDNKHDINDMKAMDYDLYDKKSGEKLYCLIKRQDENANQSRNYK